MTYRWVLRPVEDAESVDRLGRELNNLPEALARSLIVRGIHTFAQARSFFRPSLNQVYDPFLMRDMDVAAARTARAIRNRERVLVYGDYDVDGTTATALMLSFLRDQGVDAQFFIPHRFRDGYGLSDAGIDHARDIGASLIVALDCGITGHGPAAYARAQGIDLVICDHHTASETIPDALAVLDPKRPDCDYPFKELSGCGVGFKLVQATLDRLSQPPSDAYAYLDLVALSIASDIVLLRDENRVLMIEGLRRIREQPRLGLRALARKAQLHLDACSTSQIVFGLGPRINAAGRLDDARLAVALMTATDEREAADLAQKMEELNERRRALDGDTLKQALEIVESSAATCMEHGLVLHRPDWHLGVIGIVASRLVERFYKPTVMLASHNGEVKGSARSIRGLNIYDALKECEPLLNQFGGHMYAAGLALPESNVPAFRDRFREAVRDRMTPEIQTPEILVDAPLRLTEVTPRFWSVLRQFGPFGPQNKNPVFYGEHLEVVGSPSIVGGGHLKFRVRDRSDRAAPPFDVIGFNMHEHLPAVRASKQGRGDLQILFSIEENTYQGRTTLQLKLRDVRVQEQSALLVPDGSPETQDGASQAASSSM